MLSNLYFVFLYKLKIIIIKLNKFTNNRKFLDFQWLTLVICNLYYKIYNLCPLKPENFSESRNEMLIFMVFETTLFSNN